MRYAGCQKDEIGWLRSHLTLEGFPYHLHSQHSIILCQAALHQSGMAAGINQIMNNPAIPKTVIINQSGTIWSILIGQGNIASCKR